MPRPVTDQPKPKLARHIAAVMRLQREGRKSREVATLLGFSLATVQTYRCWGRKLERQEQRP